MDILKLQKRLNELGYTVQPMAPNYGPKTKAAVKAFQADHGLVIDGIAGPATLARLFENVTTEQYIVVSRQTVDLIIEFEIGSPVVYKSKYQHPVYPGAGSGITIGIGYDLGYNTPAQIRADWGDLLPSNIVESLVSCSGRRRSVASQYLKYVKGISIPYEAAYQVYLERTLPRYASNALAVYAGLDQLLPDAAGAIISLVYNRGTLLVGATRTEMAAIKPLIKERDYTGIARQIRAMKRLWDGISDDGLEKRIAGLLSRRDQEAALVAGAVRQYASQELVRLYL